MSARPGKVGNFNPNSQAPSGRVVNPTINIGNPGLTMSQRGNSKPSVNPKGGNNHKSGSYPKNSQKLRG